jgi:hypothetical protein
MTHRTRGRGRVGRPAPRRRCASRRGQDDRPPGAHRLREGCSTRAASHSTSQRSRCQPPRRSTAARPSAAPLPRPRADRRLRHAHRRGVVRFEVGQHVAAAARVTRRGLSCSITCSRKHFPCDRDAIQRRRKTGVHRHLLNHFDDFVAGGANVKSRVDMHFQLRLRSFERRQQRNGGQLFGTVIKAQSGDRVPVRKVNNEPAQVRSDLFKALYDFGPEPPLTSFNARRPRSCLSSCAIMERWSGRTPRRSNTSLAANVPFRLAGKPA